MMIPRRHFLILLVLNILIFQGASAVAQGVDEVSRLSGFAQHQKDNLQYDKAREQGERAYLETEEQWEALKERELNEYRKQAKQRSMSDEGPEFQQDNAQKKAQEKVYEENRSTYLQERARKRSFDRQALSLPSEEKELGLDQERPRYDYRKRASFGATPKLGKSTLNPGRSGGGAGSGSFGGGSPSFPPPPTFDDFQDGGYMPAPTLDSDYMGDIPPPPPPPPPFGMDGGFNDGGGDFPPPPPPTFGEEGGDF